MKKKKEIIIEVNFNRFSYILSIYKMNLENFLIDKKINFDYLIDRKQPKTKLEFHEILEALNFANNDKRVKV